MSMFEEVLGQAVAAVPDCLAAGYIDMESGMLLGVQTVDSHPEEVLNLLAAATTDLFQGPTVVNIEQIFKRLRGLPDDDFHYFREIMVNSENLIHVFLRARGNHSHVACFVCRLSANLGMILTKARGQLPLLEAGF